MMFFIITLISAIATVADALLYAYSMMVLAYCLISWVNPDPYNPIVRFLRNVSEPVLWRIRKYLPFTYFRGFDISPIILLVGIQFTQKIVNYLFTSFIIMLS